jgi:transcriptional regulator with XRE-family HTH domain
MRLFYVPFVPESVKVGTMAIALTSRYRRILRVFGKRLREARIKAGYKSAQQFAYALGIEPATYRFYERGQSQPNFEVLTRICELLEVGPQDLLPEADHARRPSASHASLAISTE